MLKNSVKQILLLAKVVTHQGQGHLSFLSNLADRDRMKSKLGKQALCR